MAKEVTLEDIKPLGFSAAELARLNEQVIEAHVLYQSMLFYLMKYGDNPDLTEQLVKLILRVQPDREPDDLVIPETVSLSWCAQHDKRKENTVCGDEEEFDEDEDCIESGPAIPAWADAPVVLDPGNPEVQEICQHAQANMKAFYDLAAMAWIAKSLVRDHADDRNAAEVAWVLIDTLYQFFDDFVPSRYDWPAMMNETRAELDEDEWEY
ncbi:hypothetical protein ACFL51_00115 [Myxococcota bacterium]